MANVLSRVVARWLPLLKFRSSSKYWQERYRLGGDSGAGSMGVAAAYKATVLNEFVAAHHVESVIEFGCGDGRQLALAQYPEYLGIDISADAVRLCADRFQTDRSKAFKLLDDYQGERADLTLSLDVIYHLVEDAVYDDYLQRLFAAGNRFVIIYSTDRSEDAAGMRHVRDRPVTADVAARFPDFVRMEEDAQLPPPVEHCRGASTRFFFYRRVSVRAS